MVATREAACRVRDMANDPTGLGRWTSMLINGKKGHSVRIVTAYNPCNSRGTNTVWDQQLRYFRNKGEKRSPGLMFQKDLLHAIQSWIDDGEHVFVMMDLNQHALEGPLATALESIGAHEVILTKHKDAQGLPATHQRNKSNKPIDACYTTLDISEVKCGYFGFGEGLPGDHRVGWVDIPFEIMFGHNPPNLHRRPPQPFNTTDPRLAKHYHKEVVKGFSEEGVFQKVDELVDMVETKAPKKKIEAKYNHLYHINLKVRKRVEKEMRLSKKGTVPWSPEMQAIMVKRRLWKCIVKLKQDVRVSHKLIRRLMRQAHNNDAWTITLEEAKKRWRDALDEWKKEKKNAPNHRKKFLERLAKARALEFGTEAASELKQIKNRERAKEAARRRRGITRKGADKEATTKLYHTVINPATGESTVEECTTQDTMGTAAISEGEARMTRCLKSPFTQPPLLDDFGYLADTPATDQVLNGTYEAPPGTDSYTKELLVEPLTKKDIEWTPELLREAWRKQKLNTGCETTGLSFGHMILGTMSKEICAVDTVLHNIPMLLGFAPKGQKRMTDLAILKKPGVYHAEKMRIIMLMNTYYNMNLKRLGRIMMEQANKYGLLPEEQYGGRKHHRAIDLGLNKILLLDLSRMKRWAMALIPFDASQCYDRINHVPAILSLRSIGMPAEPITYRFKTYQETQHYAATAYGISTQTYGGDQRGDQGPVQGVGQGAGDAGGVWNVQSARIVDMVRTKGLVMSFMSVFSYAYVCLMASIFIDDTNQGITAPTCNNPGEDMLKATQEAADTWGKGIERTGGAINQEKSCWYHLDYTLNTVRKWIYRKKNDLKGSLWVTDKDGERKLLERKEPHEAVKWLGIYLAPDGNTHQQAKYLYEKTVDFGNKVI